MGLASDRKLDHRSVEPIRGIRVIDTIEMKESYGVSNAPGVVAILDSFRAETPQVYVGKLARVSTAPGCSIDARIEGVRDHGKTISFFFKGLTTQDIPIGSEIEVDG